MFDGRTHLVAATELIPGIHLCLHNSPELFHWAMIDAMPNAGHGLLHTLLRELELEFFTGILEPPVTGEQLYRFLLRLKKYIDIDEIGGWYCLYIV